MASVQRITVDEVIGFFDELEDPRSTVNRQHPLAGVIVIALMAVLAGAAGPTAIAHWAAAKREFLLNLLDLPDGCRTETDSDIDWSFSSALSNELVIRLRLTT